jgi:Ca2+-transporting ATPase
MDIIYTGLTSVGASKARGFYGENVLPEKKETTLFMSFLQQFRSPLIYVLLAVALVTMVLAEYSDAIVIMFVVVVNAVIGTFQNRKANNVVASLKTLSRSKSKVIRDNVLVDVTINEVTVGDLVVLAAGDIVPADGVLMEYTNLQINESKINGESMPISKSAENNKVYRSTVVISGSGIFVVEKIGADTLIGELSKDILENVDNETVLEKKIRALVRLILISVIISTIALFVIGLIRDIEIFELFKTSISLAVSAIPEGLPIVVTIVLSVGAWRISKVKGLLKNLPSGATLATVSYICTDKTGTLTEGDIVVKDIINLGVHDQETLLEYITHSLDIKKIGESTVGDILDVKMYEHLKAEGTWLESKELPFTSENKFNAKEYMVAGKHVQVFKGAPELFMKDNKQLHGLVSQGFRVLGVGYKEVSHDTDFYIHDVIPLALVVFEDPIRKDVAAAIADCKSAGLSIIMITGDNIHTAAHVARTVGIVDNEQENLILESKDIREYSDEKLSELLPRLKVLARANPLDKLRIVRLLQQQNHIVAMTGDGVNDGPSIALADIGIAMGKTGTEVAKEAADFILVNDNFSNIRDGIFEARTIIENIKKTLIFLLSTSLGEILIVIGSLVIGLPMPLLPAQILWINLITDGFLDISLAQEPAEEVFKTYNYKRYHGALLRKKEFSRMALMSITMATVSLVTFTFVLKFFVLEAARTIMLVVMTIIQWFNALNVRKHTASLFSHNFFENRYLIGALLFETALLLLSLYTSLGNQLLKTVALDFQIVIYMMLIATSIICIDELYKNHQRKTLMAI